MCVLRKQQIVARHWRGVVAADYNNTSGSTPSNSRARPVCVCVCAAPRARYIYTTQTIASEPRETDCRCVYTAGDCSSAAVQTTPRANVAVAASGLESRASLYPSPPPPPPRAYNERERTIVRAIDGVGRIPEGLSAISDSIRKVAGENI